MNNLRNRCLRTEEIAFYFSNNSLSNCVTSVGKYYQVIKNKKNVFDGQYFVKNVNLDIMNRKCILKYFKNFRKVFYKSNRPFKSSANER